MNAAVLCVRADSVYREIPGLDLYDEARDAFTFCGTLPVVAHPPCRLFGKVACLAKASASQVELENRLALFCADKVRENGGVLEHPAGSRLFRDAGLPFPGEGSSHEFTIEVPQYWFGHLAQKRTWLYIAGVQRQFLPSIPLRLENFDRREVENLSKRQREATPRALAEWLVETALRCAPAGI